MKQNSEENNISTVLEFEDNSNNLQSLVLRRPAGVAWEKAEKVLRREFQLLNALKHQKVAIPEAVSINEDKSVIGALFIMMNQPTSRN